MEQYCGTVRWNSVEKYGRRVKVWSREQWNSTVKLWNSTVDQCGTVWNGEPVWQSVVEPGRIKVGR